ncbi:hypothetical protein NIES4106_60070 (plasmid) [Fischerella sp. NIES-4106]|nr:hypothetical protein NIES4106_60070 [Fischerella sp. NIES-4106]
MIKSRNSLFIVVCSFGISLIIALIHTVFTINIIVSIFGLTLFFSGLFLTLINNNIVNIKPILALIKRIVSTTNNQRIITTNGGNYNENIGRDSIGRDYINQYITIGERQVEVSPDDIVQTCDDLKDILTEMIAQSSKPVEAISEFAKELAEQLREHPEVKMRFNVEEDSSEKELVDGIIKVLLTQEYYQIENINTSGELGNIKYLENDKNSEEQYKKSISYKGYTIGLLKGRNNKWIYRIQRNDSSFLKNPNRGGSYVEDYAIKKAKAEIDKEITEIFDNQENINTLE